MHRHHSAAVCKGPGTTPPHPMEPVQSLTQSGQLPYCFGQKPSHQQPTWLALFPSLTWTQTPLPHITRCTTKRLPSLKRMSQRMLPKLCHHCVPLLQLLVSLCAAAKTRLPPAHPAAGAPAAPASSQAVCTSDVLFQRSSTATKPAWSRTHSSTATQRTCHLSTATNAQ
jgi:hypothetical protein